MLGLALLLAVSVGWAEDTSAYATGSTPMPHTIYGYGMGPHHGPMVINFSEKNISIHPYEYMHRWQEMKRMYMQTRDPVKRMEMRREWLRVGWEVALDFAKRWMRRLQIMARNADMINSSDAVQIREQVQEMMQEMNQMRERIRNCKNETVLVQELRHMYQFWRRHRMTMRQYAKHIVVERIERALERVDKGLEKVTEYEQELANAGVSCPGVDSKIDEIKQEKSKIDGILVELKQCENDNTSQECKSREFWKEKLGEVREAFKVIKQDFRDIVEMFKQCNQA